MNNVKPVILAGGLGSRLRPYTYVVPKPLLPIGEHPIISCQLRWLRNWGFTEVAIALGWRGDLIKAFIGDGSKFGLKIHYVQEDQRLGTAGPLALLKDWAEDKDVLSMNGDLLTKLNLEKFVHEHKRWEASITVATRHHEIHSPFGVLDVDVIDVVKVHEKPIINQLVSAGIYLLSNEVVQDMPTASIDMTAVMMAQVYKKKRVLSYLFEEPWVAIEQLGDLQSLGMVWTDYAHELEVHNQQHVVKAEKEN